MGAVALLIFCKHIELPLCMERSVEIKLALPCLAEPSVQKDVITMLTPPAVRLTMTHACEHPLCLVK